MHTQRDEPAPNHIECPCIAVIGGGPAGLMAADAIATGGAAVNLYDSMPSVGRKFLMAGKGGLNLTHAESREEFLSHYGERRSELEPLLDQFGPDEVQKWVRGLGIETFVGSSSRVFPVGMKTGPLLHAWVERLRDLGVTFHTRHKWCGWSEDGSLLFETGSGTQQAKADATILALGGGSWSRLGSTGEWVPLLAGHGIRIAPLKPSNCGFDVPWSDHFRTRFQGVPLKAVILSFTDSRGKTFSKQGEFIVTEEGIEGSLIYAFSARLRDEIESSGKAIIKLDLAPGWSRQRLVERLSLPRGTQSMANHLRKAVKLQGVKAGLLWEFVPRSMFNDPEYLAGMIKELPVPLVSPRPLDEAISTAGGVLFEELNDHLMVRSMPGVFCSGEMLDWEAPTGGYLITACLASGRAAGLGALAWLNLPG